MINVDIVDRPFSSENVGQWRQLWQSFRKHRLGMIGLVMLTLILLGVIFVPVFFSDPYGRVANDSFLWSAPIGTVDPATGHRYWLGSDIYGRDNLALSFEAGRLSFIVAFMPTVIILVLGFVIGALAGYFGGWIDAISMRVADFLLALPLLPAYLVALRVINEREAGFRILPTQEDAREVLLALIIAFVLFGWMGVSRLVRGMVLLMRTYAYIEAARALGASTWRIMFRHLLPNAATPMLIAGMFALGDFIVMEAMLSYFGMGFRDSLHPPMVSWGNIMATNIEHIWTITNLNPFENIRPFIVIFPALLLFLTVLSINFIGDALRDVLDPHRQD